MQASQATVEVEIMSRESEPQEMPERCTQSGSKAEAERDNTETTEDGEQKEGMFSFSCKACGISLECHS